MVATLGAGAGGCSAETEPGTSSGGSGGAGGLSGGAGGAGGASGSVSSAGVGGGGMAGSGGGAAGVAGGGGSGGSGGAGLAPTFATVKSIIQMSCFGGLCHDLPENPLQLKVDDKLYTTLTTHMTETCGIVVKPGMPQDSALVKLLKGPCNGTDRMPFNMCFNDGDEGCVSPEEIAAIEQWIASGAPM